MSSITSLYRKIEVWKQNGHNNMVRFTCFELLEEKKFCVQSADYFYLPIDDNQLAIHNKQQIELFIDLLPNERSGIYDSLVEAITAHEMEFNSQ